MRTFIEQLINKCFKTINYKGYPFFKKNLSQKTKFFMKLCPIKTNFETTISKSINHTEFVYCWQETFLLDLLWQIFSCHFMKSNSLSSVQKNLNQFFTEDMLMTVLFSLNRLNTSRNFVIILLLVIQTCLFPFNKKKKEICHFLILKNREKEKFPATVYNPF